MSKDGLSFDQHDLIATAETILDMRPDPAPRFRLLRDVLGLGPSDPEYRDAANQLHSSKWVKLLADSQQADGTWGRFHSQDTCVRQPFPTTESAITAALDLGLDEHSIILSQVLPVLIDHMSGKTCWPDPPEKHDNPLAWYVWARHYSAATMALIDRHHPRLDEFWAIWAEAVEAAFQSGTYDRQAEIVALNRLLDCRMKNPTPFHTRYPLLILSATTNRLPRDLERKVLEYVLHHPSGIYYVYDKDISVPPSIQSRRFWSWCRAHQLLSRFSVWQELSTEAANWIWAQRTPERVWDSGSGVSCRPYSSFPLSESWRRPANRIIDCTVETLALLAKRFPPAGPAPRPSPVTTTAPRASDSARPRSTAGRRR